MHPQKQILIVGNGFVGTNLYKFFSQKYTTHIIGRKDLDLTNDVDVRKYFSSKNKPYYSHIIYAAGIKDINLCEQNKELATQINTEAPKTILETIISDIKFIYISTDYVFSGDEGGIYTEKSQANPKTFYGISKMLGEITTNDASNGIVVRTSGLYGSGSPWIKWLLDELDKGEIIECYRKVINSPTYVINFAEMLERVMFDDVNKIKLIHLAAWASNRYNLYKKVALAFGKNEKLLKPIDTIPTRFPKDISLNPAKYNRMFDDLPNTIDQGLFRMTHEN
jgi:dTDP-4-dehydrorhamnose reductase